MSSKVVVLRYADSSVDIVEQGLRLFFQTWPDIRGLVCDFAGTSGKFSWPSRRRQALMHRQAINPVDDPYLHQVALRVSKMLDGRGFSLQTELVNGKAIMRVIPEE